MQRENKDLVIINTQRVLAHYGLPTDKTDGEITHLNKPIRVFRLRSVAGILLIPLPFLALILGWELTLLLFFGVIAIHFDIKKKEVADRQAFRYLKRRFFRLIYPVFSWALGLRFSLKHRRRF